MIGLAVEALKMIGGGVVNHFKEKSERKKIELQSASKIAEAKTSATIKRIESGDQSAINMDALSVQDRGWKDEYLLFIVTLPLILCFFPVTVPYVEQGFIALESTPEWFRWLLLGVYIDTFGFRRIFRNVLESLLKRHFTA